MAAVGQTLVNPASRERITFRRTAAETGGELLAIDLELPPGGRVPGGLHLHPLQEERFEVLSGVLRVRVGRLGRRRVVAGPGEVVVVPAGTPHDFANPGGEDTLVRVEVRPALQMERLFETAVALAEQGRTMRNGIPKPLDLALFVREFEQEVRGAFPPLWLQRIVLAPLAWGAERRGRRVVHAPGSDRLAQSRSAPPSKGALYEALPIQACRSRSGRRGSIPPGRAKPTSDVCCPSAALGPMRSSAGQVYTPQPATEEGT